MEVEAGQTCTSQMHSHGAFSGLNRVKSCLLPMIFLASLQQAWGVSPSTSLISERHPPQPPMLWAQSGAGLLDGVFHLSWNKQPPVRNIWFSKEDPLSWKPWNDVQNSRGANRNATCYEPYHLPGFPDVIVSLSRPREQFLIHGCVSISRLLALLKQNLISKLCPLPSALTSTHTPLFPYDYTHTFIHLQVHTQPYLVPSRWAWILCNWEATLGIICVSLTLLIFLFSRNWDF